MNPRPRRLVLAPRYIIVLTVLAGSLSGCASGATPGDGGTSDGVESTATPSPSATAPTGLSESSNGSGTVAASTDGGVPHEDSGGSDAPGSGDGATASVEASFSTKTNSLEISGTISGVSEDSGDCRFTASNSAPTLPKMIRTRGEALGAETSCGTVSLPAAELTAGEWTIVLSYRSRESAAQSPSITVTVP